MPRATRVGELLAFDLALSIRQPGARPRGAPSLFSSEARGESQVGCALAGFDEAGRGALAGPVVVGCVQLPRELLAEPDRIAEALGGVDDSKRLTARAREAAFLEIARCAVLAVGCASASEIDAVGIVEAARRAACRAYRRLGVPCDLAVFDRGLSMGAAVALDPGCLAQSAKQLGSSAETYGCRTPDLALGIGCRRSLSSLSSRSSDRPVELCRSVGASAPTEPNELNEPNEPNELSPDFPPGVAFTRGDMRSLHVAAASIVAKVTRDHLMERLDLAFPGFELSRHKGYGTEAHRRAIVRLGPSPIHRRTFLHFAEGAKSQSC
jgi:ribonuclease HII